MRVKFNVLCLILIFVMGTFSFAYGTEAEKKDTESTTTELTYEEAAKKAIRESTEYNTAIINAEKATSINEDMPVSSSYNLAAIQGKQSAKLNDIWSEMQIATTADRVANNIKNEMDNLSLMLEEEKVAKNKLAFLEYKLRMETLKFKFGMVSKADIDELISQKNSEAINLKALGTQIKGAYGKLNAKLGMPLDKIYPLEFELIYEAIEEIDLTSKYNKDAAEDPYLWYAKESLTNKEFKLVTYEYNVSGQSWTLTDLDVSDARRNLADVKLGLQKTIQDRFNSLLQIEESLSGLENSLQQAHNLTNILGVQFVAGMATNVQVEESKQNIEKLKFEILKLQLQHEQAKILFEKPYLAPEYFSAG